MRPLLPRLPFAAVLACVACSTAGPVPPTFGALLAEAPAGEGVRLWLDGDRLVGAAVPIPPGGLPAAARRMVEAVAPRGELVFQGREWGAHGAGFRVDKQYREAGAEHSRSVLVTADGEVLERDHTVPIADVPQHVLAGALSVGSKIDEARIVSGPEREQHWTVLVRDRAGRTAVVTVALDGRVLGSRRRLAARLEG